MTYSWKNNWIWKFESIWCSLQKFKYANELTDIDIGRLINASQSLNKKIYIYSSLYIAQNRIEKKFLHNLLEKDVFDDLDKDLKKFLGPLYNNLDIKKYVVSTFRYCPKCIEQGYHSIFHQLNFFNKCIFHNIKLQTKCPSCELENSYTVKYRGINTGFSCSCGYIPFINSIEEIFNKWNDTKNFTYNKTIKNIECDNIKYMYSSFKYYINKDCVNKIDSMNNSDIYISFIEENNNNNICTFIPSLKNEMIPSLLDKKNSIYDYLGNIMMNQYITIFKSIARHIRRNFIKKVNMDSLLRNRMYYSCSLYDFFNLENYNNGIRYNEIDENLYAYIIWRIEVEGHETCETLHTPITHIKNANTDYFIRQNICDTLFYKYIKHELNDYINNYKDSNNAQFNDYGILVSSFERIIGNTLIQYFYDCLSYAKYIKYNKPNERINLNISIPINSNDFLIGYNTKTKYCHLKMYKRTRTRT